MSTDEFESEETRLDSKARARDNERLWGEEAMRRDCDLGADPDGGRALDEVLRDARGRLR